MEAATEAFKVAMSFIENARLLSSAAALPYRCAETYLVEAVARIVVASVMRSSKEPNLAAVELEMSEARVAIGVVIASPFIDLRARAVGA